MPYFRADLYLSIRVYAHYANTHTLTPSPTPTPTPTRTPTHLTVAWLFVFKSKSKYKNWSAACIVFSLCVLECSSVCFRVWSSRCCKECEREVFKGCYACVCMRVLSWVCMHLCVYVCTYTTMRYACRRHALDLCHARTNSMRAAGSAPAPWWNPTYSHSQLGKKTCHNDPVRTWGPDLLSLQGSH